MIAELTHRMSGVENYLLEIGLGMRGLDARMRVLTDQQATLIELLTPKEKPKQGGMRLDELLAQMIVRLDTQNYLLKDVSDTVSQAVTALPLSVVAAIADAFGSSDEPPRTAPQNGHGEGAV